MSTITEVITATVTVCFEEQTTVLNKVAPNQKKIYRKAKKPLRHFYSKMFPPRQEDVHRAAKRPFSRLPSKTPPRQEDDHIKAKRQRMAERENN
jgi:hypothetical protein